MRHYVYKTTCTINNKYYYGVHTEKRVSDGYIGCGIVSHGTAKRLKEKGVSSYFLNSVLKYGYKNFKKEIICEFDNIDHAYEVEELILDDNELNKELCMNLKLGGFGGVIPSTCVEVTIIDCEDNNEITFKSLSDCASFLGLQNVSKAKRMCDGRYVKKEFAEPVSLKNVSGKIFNFADVYIASKKTGIKVSRVRELIKGKRNSCNGYFHVDFDFKSNNWRGVKKYRS